MTTYTPSLRLAEPVPGDPAVSNQWGTILNTNFTLLESAITDAVNVNIGGLTTYSLTTADGAADQARPLVQQYTGALIGNCTVTLPNVPKIGYAINATTGGYNVILTSGAGTQTIIPPNSNWYFFEADGAGNVNPVPVAYASGIFSNLTVSGTLTAGSVNATGVTAGTIIGTSSIICQAASGDGYAALSTGNGTGPGTVAFYTPSNMEAGFIGSTNGSGFLQMVVGAGYTGYIVNNCEFAVNGPFVVTGTNTATFGGAVGIGGTVNITGSTVFSNTGFYFTGGGGLFDQAWTYGIALNSAGGILSGGFFTISDARTKTEIADIAPEEGVDWVLRGRPRTYLVNGKPSAGFIAQEDVQSGRGAAVSGIADAGAAFAESDGVALPGFRLTRDYNHDVPYLTAALQSVLARLEALEGRVAALAGG